MIRASEEATVYYAFDDETLIGYKHWAEKNHKVISKNSFYDYIISTYDMSDFEEDIDYSYSLDFEEDLKEKIKNLND